MPGLTRWNTESNDPLARIADVLEKLNDTIDDLEETINFSTVALLTDDSEMTLRVKWKKLREGAQIPVRKGAAYDIYLPETVTIRPGETVVIGLGFACKLPEGWHAVLNTRSSTWGAWMLFFTNGEGIIDGKFCGNKDEWGASFYLPPSAEKEVVIPAGTRLTQFRLERDCPMIEFEEVDSLEDESRGGFGSTGL